VPEPARPAEAGLVRLVAEEPVLPEAGVPRPLLVSNAQPSEIRVEIRLSFLVHLKNAPVTRLEGRWPSFCGIRRHVSLQGTDTIPSILTTIRPSSLPNSLAETGGGAEFGPLVRLTAAHHKHRFAVYRRILDALDRFPVPHGGSPPGRSSLRQVDQTTLGLLHFYGKGLDFSGAFSQPGDNPIGTGWQTTKVFTS